jgi:glycerophosphoryl diester phosphodiesterase
MKFDFFDLEGHRGCRGLMPENSIPGFIKAIDLGVTTLEMDVVISKDQKVVVSHDAFFSHEFCLKPDGSEIKEEEERSYKLFEMTYEEIKAFDCGSKVHPRFPKQVKMPVYKPLLEDVIDVAETHASTLNLPKLFYNIEIKSTVEGDNVFHPPFEVFTDLLINVLQKKGILDRTIVQCFDLRPLQYLHKTRPEVTLSFLVENTLSFQENLSMLGFIPAIYSPEYILVDHALMKFAKDNNMKVIPWTVNEVAEMKKLIEMGVDGLISDYVDRYEELK